MMRCGTNSILFFSCCLFVGSCSNQYSDIRLSSIQGKLYYDGVFHQSLQQPAVGIFAMVEPNAPIPHALNIYQNPEFTSDGFDYELNNLDPFAYTVIAIIIDMQSPNEYQNHPTGFWPNLCEMQEGKKVEIPPGVDTVTDIDFWLYDQGGLGDPCLTR